MWHPMYRQGLPATISYPPRSRLPHGVGVGSPLSLSFFPRLPGSSLTHGVCVGSLPSLSFSRLPGLSLPHGVGVGSPPSLSLFWRFPRKSSLIVSHKLFVCLSESLGVKSTSHQQSLLVQFLKSYSTSSQTIPPSPSIEGNEDSRDHCRYTCSYIGQFSEACHQWSLSVPHHQM